MYSQTPTLTAPAPLRAAGTATVQAARLTLQRLSSGRGRRVFFLLVGVWLLNLFDLTLTLLASADGILHEENPLARALLRQNPAALLAFKLSVLALGTAVLFNLRRFRCAELASTLVLVVYAGVALQWKLCYEMYDIAHTGAASQMDHAYVDAIMRIVPVL